MIIDWIQTLGTPSAMQFFLLLYLFCKISPWSSVMPWANWVGESRGRFDRCQTGWNFLLCWEASDKLRPNAPWGFETGGGNCLLYRQHSVLCICVQVPCMFCLCSYMYTCTCTWRCILKGCFIILSVCVQSYVNLFLLHGIPPKIACFPKRSLDRDC